MQAGAPAPLQVRLATGTLKVRLDDGRNEAWWVDWLEARLDACPPSPGADDAPTRAHRVAGRQAPGAVDPPGASRWRRSTAPLPPAQHDDDAHAWDEATLATRTGGDADGLAPDDAARRLAAHGPNALEDIPPRSATQILLSQFDSVPVALLGGSAALALATRAVADAGAIAAVLAANAGLGFVTERRAEQTVSSLRRLAPQRATVWRGGEAVAVDARHVVVGDVLLLRPGDPVPADARLLQVHRLATNEAALTGESLPVRKNADGPLPPDTPLGERHNMVFMGTVVSGGTGRALVVATGHATALGRIRALAQNTEAPRTQLQQELDQLGRRLALGAGLLCAGVFAMGLLRGRPALAVLRSAVSLGVAAIPEGLPTVATSLLAAGVRTLQARQVYARRLDAVENLGAVDVVCFDKTGTLTENRMRVASVAIGARLHMLRRGSDTDGGGDDPALPGPWLEVAAQCHTLEVSHGADGQTAWEGSSTEQALVHFAARHGVDALALAAARPALEVRHRSEHHPYLVTVHAIQGGGRWIAVKGRPDAVLARCDRWHDGRRTLRLTAATRERLLAQNDRLAALGHRVLALAWRQQADADYGDTGGLCWLGLAGLADPPRADLPALMDRLRAAGIRPLMITGDQPGTAQAVANAVGLDGGRPLVDAATLPETADGVAHAAATSPGFARTSPAMKLQIVRALQQQGHVVAMTGDGINDGPALKTADVGVAMGVTGTDFAHAMSDLVLREDHPAALLPAIAEGRTAFLNIRKSVRYLVATNLSELAATTLAVAVGAPEPFDPLHLLWTNLATDVLPAIALGLEPAEPGVLDRPPVSLRGGLLDRREWAAVATDAGVMTAGALAAFALGWSRHGSLPAARTLAFTTLTTSQLVYSLAMRSPRPLRHGGLQPNPLLRRALIASLAAQGATLWWPAARRLLRTTPLGPADLAVAGALSLVPLGVRELLKERHARHSPGVEG